jgi:hypothetical protein
LVALSLSLSQPRPHRNKNRQHRQDEFGERHDSAVGVGLAESEAWGAVISSTTSLLVAGGWPGGFSGIQARRSNAQMWPSARR